MSRDRDYTPALVGAYIATPFLATGIAFGLGALSGDLVFGHIVLGVLLGAAAPAIVHFAHDRPSLGLAAWLAVPGIFLGTGLIVTLISFGILSASRDTDTSTDEDIGLSNLPYALIAGLVGGALATTAWAIYDVLAMQRLAERARVRASHATLRFMVLPTPTGVAAVLGGRF